MHIVFRCDVFAEIGFGHWSRCQSLSLAALEHGHQVSFLTLSEQSKRPLSDPNISIYQAHSEQRLKLSLLGLSADWLIFDGYHLSAEKMACYQDTDVRIGLFDDVLQDCPLNLDLLLSPAGLRWEKQYQQRYPKAKLLCGYDYALLKPEFCLPASSYTERQAILLSFGGSDIKQLSLPTLKWLCQQGDLDIHLVVTDAMGDLEQDLSSYPVKVHRNLSSMQMATLMREAKLAIVAAGSTIFELASCGVPSVICQVADNQSNAVVDFSTEAGFVSIDCRTGLNTLELEKAWRFLTQKNLSTLHFQAKQMVDGLGCGRVLQALEQGAADARV